MSDVPREIFDKAKAMCMAEVHRGDSLPGLLEFRLSKSPAWSYFYALTIIRGPWTGAEAIIKTDASVACAYAVNILGGRFYEAEEHIARTGVAEVYLHSFPDAKVDWVALGWKKVLDDYE